MNIGCVGAIIGDIAGSVYEFQNTKSKDFTLFGPGCAFTDDSIMTIATMKALMDGGEPDNYVYNYQLFGNRYPSSYGGRFSQWLTADNPQPYDSWGNGSAMRVSPVAWYYDDLAAVEHAAMVSAGVTHDHPDGIKGAQSTAAAIYLARTGKSKAEIKRYIEQKYGYLLDFTLHEIRPGFVFDESCEGTVPPALVAFLESTDFEDAIRNAISLGGDSDTIAAITGSVAEAHYGIPDEMRDAALRYLDAGLVRTVEAFNTRIAGTRQSATI